MKKTILFSILILIGMVRIANANVITVSNTSDSPGQYTNLQIAINAANAGDSIYVVGSNTTYGEITINKRLILVGTRAYPDKKHSFVSIIDKVHFDSLSYNTDASGSIIDGFNINLIEGRIGNPNMPVLNNIQIKRNIINGTLTVIGSNWLIQNNICMTISLQNNFNIIVKNNIIYNQIDHSNRADLIITNNLFLGNNNNKVNVKGYGTLASISNALISNNIFYGSDLGNNNCKFYNNLTYNSNQNELVYGNNIGNGNIINQNPKFVNTTVNPTFNTIDDYRLSPTSPGHNAGTDGTDIGPFGGSNPMTIWK